MVASNRKRLNPSFFNWARNLTWPTACAAALVVSVAVVATCPVQAASAREKDLVRTDYTSKTPYEPRQDLRSLQRPPSGYVPVFTQHVARHGSRTLSSKKYDDLALQIWEKAKSGNSLTRLGEQFGPEVKLLMAANEKLGYGNLTERGMQEHREMAVRVQRRLPELFKQMRDRSERIDFVSSGRDRAVDSGRNFAEGLAVADPAIAYLMGPQRTDQDLLYFHKSAASTDYQAYLTEDVRLKAALQKISSLDRTRTVARHLLKRLFTAEFVRKLTAGDFAFVDSDKGDTRVTNEVDAALVIYNLYLITPGMRAEGNWDFERFIEAGDAAWLAYLTDAEDFYEKGPAFEHNDITYRMASVLLDDFFAQIEGKISGSNDLGAVFRFTHAEEIIPLAALMKLPGSTKQVAAEQLYTYQNNSWRGAYVSPMGANIQWDLFRRGDQYLVRMLYNEAETAFKTDCKPVAETSYFYAVNELQRCFHRSQAQQITN